MSNVTVNLQSTAGNNGTLVDVREVSDAGGVIGHIFSAVNPANGRVEFKAQAQGGAFVAYRATVADAVDALVAHMGVAEAEHCVAEVEHCVVESSSGDVLCVCDTHEQAVVESARAVMPVRIETRDARSITTKDRTYAAAALATMNDDGLDWIQLTPGRILLAQPDGAWIAKSTDSDMLPILLERVGDCWMKDDGDEEHEGELVGIAGGPQSLPSLVSALVAKQDEKEATPYAQGYALRRSSPDAPMICNYPHGSTERNEWFIGWNAADALAAALVAKQDDGDEEHEVGHGGDCAKQMHGMAECTCGFDENADPDDLAPQMHEAATMMHALADKLADTSAPFDLIKRLHDVADDMEQLAGESLDKAEEARRVFEVLGQGFNGGTDATDDRVLWIVADSLNDVTAAINGMGGSVSEIPDMDDERAGRLGTIDFILPDDTAALRERMAKWVQA